MFKRSPIGQPDWFQKVFGFAERNYEETARSFTFDPETGILISKHLPARPFVAGLFTTPSLSELRVTVDLSEARKRLGGKLSVRQQVSDVSRQHCTEENRFAVFQVASQFNTLEHASQHGLPEHGITCYASDRTQGPACATACAPGTVVRNYFAFGAAGGQTHKRQVENLADVERLLENNASKYFRVASGYLDAEIDGLERLSEALASKELAEAVRSSLRIGVQKDTEVVCSNFGSEMCKVEPGQQLVTQVYCSAVSVSYSQCSATLWEPFARLVLEAAYEATLYVAVANALRLDPRGGSRRVFLTALGGGVFGNRMEWIHDAIVGALDKFRDIGLEVVLVAYGRPDRDFERIENRFAG